LTGLANRPFFLELVDRAIRRAARHGDYHFAVVYVDLERFKLINESLGHSAGDELLVALARRLGDAIRPNDVAARVAGDEFVLLLDGLRAPPDAATVAERVIAALDAPFVVREREIYVTPTVGIAFGRATGADAEQHLKQAREAVYAGRNAGRQIYGVFEETVRRRVTQRLQLETDLRKAIAEEELRAVYQPIVDLESGATVGFEALVRWQHRERGVIAPGEFIPAAEETGLVVPIGWWMVETGAAQLAAWHREFPGHPVTVNVNLSVRQLRQPRLCERILAALDAAGAPRGRLKLEVTESMLLDDAETQLATLRQLREAGIGVVIDDFGTGYSSLSYLQRFEFDVLKIDRSFLPTEQAEDAWDLVRTIITLAHDRGAAVVAEGVESEMHATRLRELGCDWGQGYWFARPLDPDAATERLRMRTSTDEPRRT
jgi:diguanylate cyclase (GGDEF)-like protein